MILKSTRLSLADEGLKIVLFHDFKGLKIVLNIILKEFKEKNLELTLQVQCNIATWTIAYDKNFHAQL